MKRFPKIITPGIDINPPIYYCRKARETLELDGNLEKQFWRDIPFSDSFLDISGPAFPTPRFRTRVKLCWDNENLYIGALLEGDEIWANITERDSVIYYDNDFEVFIDPCSSGHHYMELEMNALNTQWDLMLTRPYRDGGRSVSAWNIPGLETAVRIEGDLNNPCADNRFWSAEIKIPFAGLLEAYDLEENPPELERCYPCRRVPRPGEFWRMNFSRVQWRVSKDGAYRKLTDENGRWLPEDNWVWAPTGMIDIHCPEFWGFVFFTSEDEKPSVPESELRKIGMRYVYYSEYAFCSKNGRFTDNIEELDCRDVGFPVKIETTGRTFLLTSFTSDMKTEVILTHDGYSAAFCTD